MNYSRFLVVDQITFLACAMLKVALDLEHVVYMTADSVSRRLGLHFDERHKSRYYSALTENAAKWPDAQ